MDDGGIQYTHGLDRDHSGVTVMDRNFMEGDCLTTLGPATVVTSDTLYFYSRVYFPQDLILVYQQPALKV